MGYMKTRGLNDRAIYINSGLNRQPVISYATDEERLLSQHLDFFKRLTFDCLAIFSDQSQPHKLNELYVSIAQNQQHITSRLFRDWFDNRKPYILALSLEDWRSRGGMVWFGSSGGSSPHHEECNYY